VIRATARLKRILRASGPPISAAISAHSKPCSRRASIVLFRHHPPSRLLDDLAVGHLMTGAAPGGETLLDHRVRIDSPLVSAVGMLPVRLPGQFIPRDGGEQFEELVGIFQVVLAEGSADEEGGEHGLADIHRFDQAAEPRVAEPDPHGAADCRLVALDELRGRPLIAGTDTPDELRERRLLAPRGERKAIGAIGPHDRFSLRPLVSNGVTEMLLALA
jgi:hypothetical protein